MIWLLLCFLPRLPRFVMDSIEYPTPMGSSEEDCSPYPFGAREYDEYGDLIQAGYSHKKARDTVDLDFRRRRMQAEFQKMQRGGSPSTRERQNKAAAKWQNVLAEQRAAAKEQSKRDRCTFCFEESRSVGH